EPIAHAIPWFPDKKCTPAITIATLADATAALAYPIAALAHATAALADPIAPLPHATAALADPIAPLPHATAALADAIAMLTNAVALLARAIVANAHAFADAAIPRTRDARVPAPLREVPWPEAVSILLDAILGAGALGRAGAHARSRGCADVAVPSLPRERLIVGRVFLATAPPRGRPVAAKFRV
ncbi:MAG TPA: hypothetical protein VMI75_39520, partial [Polyangiaceae bacterium]|nr:hypothetical protein [Polyangiaceae bacterium]